MYNYGTPIATTHLKLANEIYLHLNVCYIKIIDLVINVFKNLLLLIGMI